MTDGVAATLSVQADHEPGQVKAPHEPGSDAHRRHAVPTAMLWVIAAAVVTCGGCRTNDAGQDWSGVDLPRMPLTKTGRLAQPEFYGQVACLPFGLVLERQDYVPLLVNTISGKEETNEYRDQVQTLAEVIRNDADTRKMVETITDRNGYDLAGKVCLGLALTRSPTDIPRLKGDYAFEWFRSHKREVLTELEKIAGMRAEDRERELRNTEKRVFTSWKVEEKGHARLLQYRVYVADDTELLIDLSNNAVETMGYPASGRKNFGPLKFDHGSIRRFSHLNCAWVMVRDSDSKFADELRGTDIYPDYTNFPGRGVIFYGGKDYTSAVRSILRDCIPVTFICDQDDMHRTFYVKREKNGQELSNQQIIAEIGRYMTAGRAAGNVKALKGLRTVRAAEPACRGFEAAPGTAVETDRYRDTQDAGWAVTADPAGNDTRWARQNTRWVTIRQQTKPTVPCMPPGKYILAVVTVAIPDLNRARKHWETPEWTWGKPDPYYEVKYGRYVEFSSPVITDSLNPEWACTFALNIREDLRTFRLLFWDYDYSWFMFNPDDHIGSVDVATSKLHEGDNDYPVNEQDHGVTALKIRVQKAP